MNHWTVSSAWTRVRLDKNVQPERQCNVKQVDRQSRLMCDAQSTAKGHASGRNKMIVLPPRAKSLIQYGTFHCLCSEKVFLGNEDESIGIDRQLIFNAQSTMTIGMAENAGGSPVSRHRVQSYSLTLTRLKQKEPSIPQSSPARENLIFCVRGTPERDTV